MSSFSICKRLLSCANFVRAGAHFADIGTDHAYLPIFLLKSGRIESAVCSDVNSGPLLIAEKNAKEANLSEKMRFILSDGADGLSGLGITDAAICGMGGELIAEIVSRADFFRSCGLRLILQPMSHPEAIRRCLCGLGYEILEEAYSSDSGKFYVALLAEYTGRIEEHDDFYYEFGALPKREEMPHEMLEYLTEREAGLRRRIEGKTLGGRCCQYEKKLHGSLLSILSQED